MDIVKNLIKLFFSLLKSLVRIQHILWCIGPNGLQSLRKDNQNLYYRKNLFFPIACFNVDIFNETNSQLVLNRLVFAEILLVINAK